MTRSLLVCIAAAGCGRIGFDPWQDAVSHVGSPLQVHAGVAAQYTFPLQASAAGDVVVIVVSCTSSAATSQTGVSIGAPRWTFAPVGSLVGSTTVLHWGASYAAIAPDTASTTLTVTWDVACSVGMTALSDEFVGAGPDLATAIDGHAETMGTGACSDPIAIANQGDLVWAACDARIHASGPDVGYTAGADDGVGDFAEYKLASAATEDPAFPGSSAFIELAVAIRPR